MLASALQPPAVLGARCTERWRGSPSRKPIRRAKHSSPACRRSEYCSGTRRALIPIRAAEALIKLEAREARLLGLDMPTKVAVTDPDGGIPLETIRRVMERVDRQMVDVTPEPAPLPLDHKRQ